jgi:hypothetical protein
MGQHRGCDGHGSHRQRAYYAVLRAEGREHLAYQTALAVYLTRHPEVPDADARRIVVVRIAEASRAGLMWPTAPGWQGGGRD